MRRFSFAGAVALVAAAALPAQEELPAADSGPLLHGQRLARAVGKVTRELHWHRGLEEAAAAARQEGKPIFWMQLLGDLRGFT